MDWVSTQAKIPKTINLSNTVQPALTQANGHRRQKHGRPRNISNDDVSDSDDSSTSQIGQHSNASHQTKVSHVYSNVSHQSNTPRSNSLSGISHHSNFLDLMLAQNKKHRESTKHSPKPKKKFQSPHTFWPHLVHRWNICLGKRLILLSRNTHW